MNEKEIEAIEFFKRRFPDKDLRFEFKVGYLQEWVTRFKKGNPEAYMDGKSQAVYDEMRKEDWIRWGFSRK